MSEPILSRARDFDYAALKRGGVMRQVTPGLFSVRLHVIAGDLDATRLRAIADIAERHGNGTVHITARQGVEIPFVRGDRIDAVRSDLEAAGLSLGACGPRVRTVTGCQGSAVCPHGLIETKPICEAIDQRFAGRELPHKLKFGVAGCRNSCLKPQENDIGVMGSMEPALREADCSACMVCVTSCERGALLDGDRLPRRLAERCDGCGDCVASCPNDAMETARAGYALYLGGRIGKSPKLGERYGARIEDLPQAVRVLDALVDLYAREGRSGERFGPMLERLDRAAVDALIEEARAAPAEPDAARPSSEGGTQWMDQRST